MWLRNGYLARKRKCEKRNTCGPPGDEVGLCVTYFLNAKPRDSFPWAEPGCLLSPVGGNPSAKHRASSRPKGAPGQNPITADLPTASKGFRPVFTKQLRGALRPATAMALTLLGHLSEEAGAPHCDQPPTVSWIKRLSVVALTEGLTTDHPPDVTVQEKAAVKF